MSTITERAAIVLQQIKERRAVIAKATPGPWLIGTGIEGHIWSEKSGSICGVDLNRHDWNGNAAFIVASRNERDTELACLETAIEWLIDFTQVPQVEADSEFQQCWEQLADEATEKLTTLCDQWEASWK